MKNVPHSTTAKNICAHVNSIYYKDLHYTFNENVHKKVNCSQKKSIWYKEINTNVHIFYLAITLNSFLLFFLLNIPLIELLKRMVGISFKILAN